ncbi:plasmid pRiA4b ORF-3 family protein [bacterium]|nr:plasmid pRiA4b ORF-3 family protein [bacterium]MBU1936520.1 plasmid pRiA4b ORF-3 family protein [bacterium]
MKEEFSQIYQFKIKLQGSEPPIWRRIQVSKAYSFWDLHVAIQDAMGWEDYHLHEFSMIDPNNGVGLRIGIPDADDADTGEVVLPGWELRICDFVSMENRVILYVYDFGDKWTHRIRLEKMLPQDENAKYPICVAGKRACPPEDCGGIPGYEELLEIVRNPTHERYGEILGWIGGEFDPEYFDVKEVHFDDPDKRRRMAIG